MGSPPPFQGSVFMRSRVDQGHALGDIGEKDIRCACILFGSIVCWLPNSSVSLFRFD